MTARDYERIEEAIRFIDEHYRSQPGLGEVARHVGLSEYHFQRLFTRWAGISPKRFLQFTTAAHARRLLRERRSVLDAAYGAGLSGGGRLHDLMVNVHAATPGEVRAGGAGLEIRFGVHPTPFGDGFVALTERGVCYLSFLDRAGRDPALAELRREWPGARVAEDPASTRAVVDQIFTPAPGRGGALDLHVKGTNFQIRVWEALLRIPPGTVATYGDVAEAVGAPGSARAVGTAVGRNPVAYLIPCHRVLRSTGGFGGYRWGVARKRALLAWEQARCEAGP